MSLSTRALRAHLLRARLAGPVATPRDKSLRNYRLFAARDPRHTCGLDPWHSWTRTDVLGLMADRCGVSADPRHTSGQDVIDPDRTIAALDAFAQRIALAAARREPLLLGTGHPHRLLGFYAALAAALSTAGCPVITPSHARRIDIPTQFGLRPHTLWYVAGVGVVRPAGLGHASNALGAHTHSPLPVRVALAGAASTGGLLPGLLIGDHGWVCGAGQLGIEAIGLADSDDPAVFVAEAEGRATAVVPLDDAVRSSCYRPLARYVLNQARLSQ